jgi:hypothetical protein
MSYVKPGAEAIAKVAEVLVPERPDTSVRGIPI